MTFELLPPQRVSGLRTVELVSVDFRALEKARQHLHETIQRLRAQQQAAERQRSAVAPAPAPAPAVRAREVLSVLRSDEALLDVVVGGVTHENLPEGVDYRYSADMDGNLLRVELSGTDASAVANVRSMIEGVLSASAASASSPSSASSAEPAAVAATAAEPPLEPAAPTQDTEEDEAPLRRQESRPPRARARARARARPRA
eukprot:COSAG01_NODE_7600_length_3132_cov_1.387076_2_plen_202_part_00